MPVARARVLLLPLIPIYTFPALESLFSNIFYHYFIICMFEGSFSNA